MGLVGALAGCEVLGPPGPLPANAQRFIPPESYHAWWTATEACSGLDGSLKDIAWYVVPDAATIETADGPKVGVWSRSNAGTRIVLAGDYVETELVVRHEMLHALLDRDGHPGEYFRTRCSLTWETWGHGS